MIVIGRPFVGALGCRRVVTVGAIIDSPLRVASSVGCACLPDYIDHVIVEARRLVNPTADREQVWDVSSDGRRVFIQIEVCIIGDATTTLVERLIVDCRILVPSPSVGHAAGQYHG